MRILKRFWSPSFSATTLAAGFAVSGVGQQTTGDNTVSTLVAVLVLLAVGLPLLMAIFGAVVMRGLSWFTRARSREDEVVYAEEQLPPGIHLPEPTIWPAVLAFCVMGLMFAVALDSWLETVALVLGALFVVLGLGGWIVVEVEEFRLRRN